MGRNNTRRGPVALADRQARALELAEARASRSHEEQITLLDQRFGEGLGATRERARLARLIAERENKLANNQKKKSVPKSRGEKRKAKARRNEERDRSRGSGST